MVYLEKILSSSQRRRLNRFHRIEMVTKQGVELGIEVLIGLGCSSCFVHESNELRSRSFVDLQDEEAQRISCHVILRARFPYNLEAFLVLEIEYTYFTLNGEFDIIRASMFASDFDFFGHGILMVSLYLFRHFSEVSLHVREVTFQEVG